MNLDDIMSKEPATLEDAIDIISSIKEAASKVVEDLGESDDKVKGLEEKNSELQGKVEELQASLEATSTSGEKALKDKDAKISELETKLADQATALHKELARKVVVLKHALGKPGVEKLDQAIEAHCTRTEDSLNDMLVDLEAEYKAKGGTEDAPTADNPLEAGNSDNLTEEKYDAAKLSAVLDTRKKRGRS